MPVVEGFGVSSSKTLTINTTQVGNIGVGEDDLMSYAVPANTLDTNGDSLEVIAWGDHAANVNTKLIKIRFGAAMLAVASGAPNGGVWFCHFLITRTGATAQLAISFFIRSADAATSTVSGAPAETLSGAVTLKFTGEATANDDLVQKGMIVRKIKA